MRFVRHAVIGAFAVAFSGCATVADRLAEDSYLVGPTWRLVNLSGPDGNIELSDEQSDRHTMIFSIDGRLALQLDCNQGTGSWNASPGASKIRISQIAATQALCPDPSFGEAMAAGLPGSDRYGFSSDQQLLTVWSGENRFTFRAAK